MIRVSIRELPGGELIAEARITDPGFDGDLARIKAIPGGARSYSGEARCWTITDPERWEHLVKELGIAVRDHRRQLKLF